MIRHRVGFLVFVFSSVLFAPTPPAAAQPPSGAEAERTELGFVPLLGGDTDIGLGGGFLINVARLAPTRRPYVWRVEGAMFIAFKRREGEGLDAPYQDLYVLASFPGLLGGRARIEVRPSFTRENNLRYYGLGNASVAPSMEIPARDFYERTRPALFVRARFDLKAGLFLVAGSSYTHNWIDLAPDSKLARDATSLDPPLRSRVLVDKSHGLHLLDLGFGFDGRDNEIAPERGQLHQLRLRVSPGGLHFAPYRYAQVTLTTRFYFPIHFPLIGRRLTLATRQVLDVQTGDVPFYELSRFEEASAIGGGHGVRGVPAGRYHGKLKVFANLELRFAATHFQVAGSRYRLGLVAFADGGRLWASTGHTRSLDGVGWGLKYGLGGGLRLQKGETFVLRGDLAWSPDARPIGAYLIAGHTF